jgi:DNA-binding MarR family transcriptional regulator
MLAKKRHREQKVTLPKKIKSPKQMERHLKGMANHYRIEILLVIADAKGMTLEDIIKKIGANPKTIGEHTRRLYSAGLINKKRRGNFIEHELSPYGKKFFQFLKSFQHD